MARPFLACDRFDLDCVFKVTTIIGSFHIETFEGGTKCHVWVWKIFIMSVDLSIKELPNICEPDQFDICQGHSSMDIFSGNQ